MSGQVKNFGCRINAYESEIIKEIIRGEDDYVVFNTCTVTAEAHRQCLQAIRKIKRETPGVKIAVTGCASTIAPDDFHGLADIIVHNERKTSPAEYVAGAADEAAFITGFDGRNRAFLQVQQGCDFSCTYCIVPKARGSSRSVPYVKIREQVERLHQNGVKEIVLAGINLSDYEGGVAALVRRIYANFSSIRLRLSSLDPAMVDDALIDLFSDRRMMPHIHLSTQSGDDLILKRMGRRHSREQVLDVVAKLRALRPELVVGSDFITGFPTETEACFANTLGLVEEAGICQLHVFPYSERPGTAAARMPGVDKAVRKERAKVLRGKGLQMLDVLLQSKVAQALHVLFETDGRGHSDEFLIVNAPGKAGNIMNVKITDVKDGELYGEVAV